MRAAIWEKQQYVPVRATFAEVVQLYGTLVLDNTVDMFSASFEAVTYPLCPPVVLHMSSDRITRIKTVDMRNIGDLIRDPDVKAKHVACLVHVLASLVDLDKKHEKGKITYHHVMPKNLVMFASQGRVHTGERLCKRAVRHSMDPSTPGIIGAQVILGEYDGEVSLTLSHQVRASMKKCLYNVTSAFSACHLIASSCSSAKQDAKMTASRNSEKSELSVLTDSLFPSSLVFCCFQI
jgi:hypothetical protein